MVSMVSTSPKMPTWPVLVVLALTVFGVFASKCPPRYAVDEIGRMCYQGFPYQKTWTMARKSCQNSKGDLVVNPTPRIIDILKTRMWTGQKYWIALNDRRREGTYSWLDGSDAAGNVSWASGQPASDEFRDCGTFDGSKYSIEACGSERKYFCVVPFLGERRSQPGVSCPRNFNRKYGWDLKKCLAVVATKKTWTEAKESCERMHPRSRLVNLHNFRIHDELIDFMVWEKSYWIGLNDKNTPGQFKWLDTNNSTYVAFHRGHPQSDEGKDCVSLKTVGKLNRMETSNCEDKMGYVCQIGPETPLVTTTATAPTTTTTTTTTTAPTTTTTTTTSTTTTTAAIQHDFTCETNDWTMYAPGRKCFKLVSNPKKWQKAREDCKRHFRGDLVAIPDADTHDFIKANVMSKERSWIGLHDEQGDGKFSWQDDSEETQYKAFRSRPGRGSANENCVELIGNHEGLWNDKVCNAKRSYICQKDVTYLAVPVEDEEWRR